jgi:hypothetical protein
VVALSSPTIVNQLPEALRPRCWFPRVRLRAAAGVDDATVARSP